MASSQPSTLDLQSLCEHGQRLLMDMHYLQAERTLVQAEAIAWQAGDFETIARLYLPLQECRRQRRQRCGEGVVCLDLLAEDPGDLLEARHVLENFPHGQLLVAGWGSIEPARQVRAMAAEYEMYVETFLAAVYPVKAGAASSGAAGEGAGAGTRRAIVIVPFDDAKLPPPELRTVPQLLAALPENCVVMDQSELPSGPQRGTAQTYGRVMAMWEKLHLPFLAAAERKRDAMDKIAAYRTAIRVDFACELAHQKLSDAARTLARG